MSNCLVTKLKGQVINDNLPYLGFITIKAQAGDSFVASQRKVQIDSSTSVTLEIISPDGYFVDNQGNRVDSSTIGFSADGRKFTYRSNITQTTTYLSNHNVEVKISKYDLNLLYVGRAITCDYNQLSYAGINDGYFGLIISPSGNRENIEALEYVPISKFSNYESPNPGLYGDVGKLTLTASGDNFNIRKSSCTGKLTIPSGRQGTLNIKETKVEFDFDTMPVTNLIFVDVTNAPNVRGNCNTIFSKINNKATTDVYLRGTQCTGSLETMLESIYSVTRTVDNMAISLASAMTFHGEHVAPILKVTFSNGDIIVENLTTHVELGRYNGSTWTYA